MHHRVFRVFLIGLFMLAAWSTIAVACSSNSRDTIILATTTSTRDSGLLDVLVPMFEEESGYTVKTVAVGSGQAIAQASRGDADVVLLHSPEAEKRMIEAGDGIERKLVMHNDFVIVGPGEDRAGIRGAGSAVEAFQLIGEHQARFVSRGDDSGTHVRELAVWAETGVDPNGASWYEESGQGMGATLQIAGQKRAYTLSDRSTFLAQRDNLDLDVLFEGDDGLLNIYHVIVVNPERHPGVHVEGARAFAAFLVRADIQGIVARFGIEEVGEPLFVADAGKPEPAE